MILERIAAYKREFVTQRKTAVPLRHLEKEISYAPSPRDFETAITRTQGIKIIAELKKASPSQGVLREKYDPVNIAQSYERHGADAISVLTDEQFFQGSIEHLKDVRKATTLPLLRKDFVIDPYQIYEARAAGADAILLIVSLLNKTLVNDYVKATYGLGMKVLLEVHNRAELDRALSCDAHIIGINNRDLKTFATDIRLTEQLLPLIPRGRIIVSESGISSHEDVRYLANLGCDAILVGERLMRCGDPGRELEKLRSRD
jgi:indole-3-glycerol phosphate synthase